MHNPLVLCSGRGENLNHDYSQNIFHKQNYCNFDDIPLNYDTIFYSEFQENAMKWFSDTTNMLNGYLLPHPVSCFYRRPQIAEKLTKEEKKYARRKKYTLQYLPQKNDPQKLWNEELISLEPSPEMFDTYEEYKQALINWMDLKESKIKPPNDIFPPDFDIPVQSNERENISNYSSYFASLKRQELAQIDQNKKKAESSFSLTDYSDFTQHNELENFYNHKSSYRNNEIEQQEKYENDMNKQQEAAKITYHSSMKFNIKGIFDQIDNRCFHYQDIPYSEVKKCDEISQKVFFNLFFGYINAFNPSDNYKLSSGQCATIISPPSKDEETFREIIIMKSDHVKKMIDYGVDSPEDVIMDLVSYETIKKVFMSDNEYNKLLNSSPTVKLDIKQSYLFYTVTHDKLSLENSTFSMLIFSNQNILSGILQKCSQFAKRTLPHFYPKYDLQNVLVGCRDEFILRGLFKHVFDYFWLQTILHLFFNTNNEAPKALLLRLPAFVDPINVYVQQFNDKIINFLQTFKEDVADISYDLFITLIETTSLNYIKINDLELVLYHFYKIVPSIYYRILEYLIFNKFALNIFVNKFFLQEIVFFNDNKEFNQFICEFINYIIQIKPNQCSTKFLDPSWILKTVFPLSLQINEMNNNKAMPVIKSTTRFIKLAFNEKLLVKKKIIKTIMSLIMQLALLFDKYDQQHDEENLSLVIDSFRNVSVLLTLQSLCADLKEAIVKIILYQGSNNINLCHSSSKFIRFFIVNDNKFLNCLNKFNIKDSFKLLYSNNSDHIQLALETLKTIADKFKKEMKVDQQHNENIQVPRSSNAILQLGNISPEVIIFSQFYAEIGVNVLKLLALAHSSKTPPDLMKYKYYEQYFTETLQQRPASIHVIKSAIKQHKL